MRECVEKVDVCGWTKSLDSVTYCFLHFPSPPCYFIPWLSHHTRSSAHLGVTRLRPSIYSNCMISSSHLGVACLFPSTTNFPLYCPHCYPRPLLHFPLAPLPCPCSLRCFTQIFPKMCLRRVLTPPCVPPASSPLISLLSWVHHRNRPQRHPLCHSPLSYPYVGHFLLISTVSSTTYALGVSHIPYAFCHSHFPVICLRKPVCVPSIFLSIPVENTQVYDPKSLPPVSPLIICNFLRSIFWHVIFQKIHLLENILPVTILHLDSFSYYLVTKIM